MSKRSKSPSPPAVFNPVPVPGFKSETHIEPDRDNNVVVLSKKEYDDLLSNVKRLEGLLKGTEGEVELLRTIINDYSEVIPTCQFCNNPTSDIMEDRTCGHCDSALPCRQWCENKEDSVECSCSMCDRLACKACVRDCVKCEEEHLCRECIYSLGRSGPLCANCTRGTKNNNNDDSSSEKDDAKDVKKRPESIPFDDNPDNFIKRLKANIE